MKLGTRLLAAAFSLAIVAAPVAAQQHANPVYYHPGMGSGVEIAGDFGLGLNDASAKTKYFGGRVTLGLPMFTISAGAGSISFDSTLTDGAGSQVSFGGSAAFNVPLGPESPLKVAIQAGFGYLKEDAAKLMSFPIGVVLGYSVPAEGVQVTPWIAPRLHIERFDPGITGSVTDTETRPGGSAGLNIVLPMGVGFHVAVDYINFSAPTGGSSSDVSPFLVGAGLSYLVKLPGM